MQSLFYRFNQNKLVHNKLQIQILCENIPSYIKSEIIQRFGEKVFE